MYFQYDESAIDYLKQKDQCLAEVIDKIRKIKREVNGVWFSSVIHPIIGRRISQRHSKCQYYILRRH